jgi:hypothetical protein
VPGLSIASLQDITSTEWQCTPSHAVISDAKLIYFGAKFLSKIPPVLP